MTGPLALPREEISALCRRFGIKRLDVFGSATTDAFDPQHSDVDFFVEFRDDVDDAFYSYFGLKEELEELLGRNVDLVAPTALRNPYFADMAGRTRQELYAA